MILVRNIRLLPGEKEELLTRRALKKLRLNEDRLRSVKLIKRSLDARKKNDIHYVCTVALELSGDEEQTLRRAKSGDVSRYEEKEYIIPRKEGFPRPVVVGFGPAGMFAALVLAMAGARPIVIERGQPVENDRRPWPPFAAAEFWTEKTMCSLEKGVPAPFPTAS